MKKFLLTLLIAAGVATVAPLETAPVKATSYPNPCYGYFNCGRPPAGAKHRCRDGTWSAVENARYACVGHYGVWYSLG